MSDERQRLELVTDEWRKAHALPTGGGGGTSGPMEPWQQSVETRLKSLDDRLGRVEPDIAILKTDMAVVRATMATKEDLHALERAIGTRVQKYLAIGGSLVVLVGAITTLLGRLIH